MLKELRPAVVLLVLLTLLTGVVYPLAVTVVAQVLFPFQANGSVLMEKDKPVGSELIGQQFSEPRYFWSRLSATGPIPYTAFNSETLTGSSGSNFGPLNPALFEAAKGRIDALRAAAPEQSSQVPVDLITASGSGLDPHISPASAEYQVARVAAARKMPVNEILDLIRRHSSGRQLGVLGEPAVNVLQLNQALDGMKPVHRVTREGIHPFGFGRFQRPDAPDQN